MLSAFDTQKETVAAWEVTKQQGPFRCPECQEEVILKKGYVNSHHFAHYPESSCTYGTGESEYHRQTKYEIYEALRLHGNGVSHLKVERHLGDVRPDVSFCWQGKYEVAIELQISPISPDEIIRRTCSYTAKRIWVLWITPYQRNLSGLTPYRTSVWERYLHTLYFGKRYYWLERETLLPVHFEPYVLENTLQKQYDEETQRWHLDWRDRFSPVLRNLCFGEEVQITDLKPMTRQSKQIGKFFLPSARLWNLPGRVGEQQTGTK